MRREPADTRHLNNARLMFGQRRRRWPNINPALGQCLVHAGYLVLTINLFVSRILWFNRLMLSQRRTVDQH